MVKTISIIITLLIFFHTEPLVCQMNIQGQVLDFKTNKSIPFSSITWGNGSKGIISDQNGFFKLNSSISDSLIFQALGYSDEIYVIKEAELNNTLIIKLKQRTFSLNEVIVVPKNYKTQKVKLKKLKTSSISSCSNYSFIIGTQFPQSKKNGYFKKIGIHFKNKGENSAVLRLRIFDLDEKGIPNIDLLRETIIITPENGWVKIDVEKYNIKIPENKYVVAVEFIKENTIDYSENCNNPKKTKISLTSIPIEKGIKVWDRRDNKKWYNFQVGKKGNYQLTPLIQVELKVEK